MQCLQLTRGEPPVLHITVTITGSGNSTYCYAIINGTKQYSAGTHEVNTGDTITFGVYGASSAYYGLVKIDGAEVLRTTIGLDTYEWTVPSGISTIEITMKYTSPSSTRNGKITVTTA